MHPPDLAVQVVLMDSGPVVSSPRLGAWWKVLPTRPSLFWVESAPPIWAGVLRGYLRSTQVAADNLEWAHLK